MIRLTASWVWNNENENEIKNQCQHALIHRYSSNENMIFLVLIFCVHSYWILDTSNLGNRFWCTAFLLHMLDLIQIKDFIECYRQINMEKKKKTNQIIFEIPCQQQISKSWFFRSTWIKVSKINLQINWKNIFFCIYFVYTLCNYGEGHFGMWEFAWKQILCIPNRKMFMA